MTDALRSFARRHPRCGLAAALLLAACLALPGLHHLVPHQDGGADSGPCPACLLLSLGFLALAVAVVLDPERRLVGHTVSVLAGEPALAFVPASGPRAPPASN